jgi:uncharacterized RDD family membrane protein YckC
MTVAEQKSSPSLLRRLVAMLYDTFLVVALIGVINGLALGVVAQLTQGNQQALSPPLVQALTTLSVVGFFCIFWIKSGQTLGMQAWRIQLVDFRGNPPTPSKALARCLGACLSAACLGLGYLWCLVDRNKRYWHDYISRTELILLPKPDKENTS